MHKRPSEKNPNATITTPDGKRRVPDTPKRTSDRVRGIKENLVQQGTSKLGSTSGPVVSQSTLEPVTESVQYYSSEDQLGELSSKEKLQELEKKIREGQPPRPVGPERRPRTYHRRSLQDRFRDLNETLIDNQPKRGNETDEPMSTDESYEDYAEPEYTSQQNSTQVVKSTTLIEHTSQQNFARAIKSITPIEHTSHQNQPERSTTYNNQLERIQINNNQQIARLPILTITPEGWREAKEIIYSRLFGNSKQWRPVSSTSGATLREITDRSEPKMVLPIPVAEIISLIQDFDGELGNLEPFIRNTDGVWELLDDNYEDTHKLRVALAIRSRLKGKAAEAIRELTENTWLAIKTLLRTNLRPQEGPKLALLQMSKIKQGLTEGLENYAKRTTDLLQAINLATDPTLNQETQNYIKTGNDTKAKDAFEDGLRDKDLRDRVIAGNLPSLQRSIEYAKEQSIRLMERKENSVPAIRCNFCQKLGHKERDCRTKERGNTGNSPKRRSFNQNFRQQSSYSNNTECHNCGRPGHYARDCRSPRRNNQGRNGFSDNNQQAQSRNNYGSNNNGRNQQNGGHNNANNGHRNNNNNGNNNGSSGNSSNNRQARQTTGTEISASSFQTAATIENISEN